MTQQTELEKVKARIRLFLDRTVENGCTEAEAMEAMGRVGSLMKQYNLTMSEVELRKTEMVTVKTKIYGRKRRPLDTCIVSLASFCECKVWHSKSKAGNYYSFFGHETDAQMAVYLYDVISSAYEMPKMRGG
ncbi:MAG: DUF2786 domain-containing protein [Oxalobacteraceae bacterium]|nr:MAG: DUF2786 domain-containing protein [Oxalobacteraceae bacterium]